MDTDFARAGAVLSGGQWQSALGVHSIGHGPRQQFIDTIDRMLADALKDIAQIRLRLDRIELGGRLTERHEISVGVEPVTKPVDGLLTQPAVEQPVWNVAAEIQL